MKKHDLVSAAAFALLCALPAAAAGAAADEYPSKPIRFIIPFAADAAARHQKQGESLGALLGSLSGARLAYLELAAHSSPWRR